MRIGDMARRMGVTAKALRYYETLGLLKPDRDEYGHRQYSERDCLVVTEIIYLGSCGIPPGRVHPFVECLDSGHENADDCPESARVFEATIADIDRVVEELRLRRVELVDRLRRRTERLRDMD